MTFSKLIPRNFDFSKAAQMCTGELGGYTDPFRGTNLLFLYIYIYIYIYIFTAFVKFSLVYRPNDVTVSARPLLAAK